MGAISYLGQSQFGLNKENIFINNINLNNSTTSAYAVTGCCSKEEDKETVITTIDEINKGTADCYVWNEYNGQKASCTGTIYGVYDMSGGVWERTAGYVANGNNSLKKYGASVAYDGNTLRTKSTKYTTVYPHDSAIDKSGVDIDIASEANCKKNNQIYGDAIRETSTSYTGSNSWYSDGSGFPAATSPFTFDGGGFNGESKCGLFCSSRSAGECHYAQAFRSVLVAK